MGCDRLTANENGIYYVGKWVIGSDKSVYGKISLRSDTVGIASSAFQNNDRITALTVPHGVKYIGSSSFSGCHELRSLYLPESIERIGPNAFKYASALTGITFSGTSERLENTLGEQAYTDAYGIIAHCTDADIYF